jgi:SAM-dependent methyltransferase
VRAGRNTTVELGELRARIAGGELRGDALRAELEQRDEAERDRWVEGLLGIAAPIERAMIAERELIGYQPSGVGAVLALIRDVPIGARDVFVDIGSGLGKVTMLVHLLTGASAMGLERDAALIARARQCAKALELNGVSYVHGDARDAVPEGSVYFMYAPVTGRALERVMARLETTTQARKVAICTLGLDLARFEWLRERASEDLFVSIYDRR